MGKDAEGGGKSYDYFGDIAGIVCAGPVDELLAILVDGHTVWPTSTAWAAGQTIAVGDLRLFQETVFKATAAHTTSTGNQPPNSSYWVRYSVTRSGNPNPYPITVAGYGAAYLYWGTSSQTLDATGEAVLTTAGHPPYRRLCVLVLKQFLFGTERVTPPNVEVIVRKNSNQSVITGTSSTMTDGQVNPFCSLAEMMTDPVFGLGLPVNVTGGLDSTTWQAAADALAATASQTDLSPSIESAVSLRTFTSQLLAYCDAWVRFNSAGKIEAGRWTHNAAPPTFTAATTIDSHDLLEEPSFDSGSWTDTTNQAFVRFTDRDRAFKDGSTVSASTENRVITGLPLATKYDRQWIVRRQQAQDQAAELVKINSVPKATGSLVVRTEKVASILPGSLFAFTHDGLAVTLVCRCLSKTIAAPPAGRTTIAFEVDRASAPIPYHPTPTPDRGTAWPANEAFSLYQFFQPPPALVNATTDAIVVPLIARTSPLTVAANVWLQKSDASLFTDLGTVTHFGITGTLQSNWSAYSIYGTSARVRASNVTTITLNSSHIITVGMTVLVTGLADNSFNGTFVVTAVTSTTLSYSNPGTNVSGVADFGGIVDVAPDDVSENLRVTLNGSTNSQDLSTVLASQSEDQVNDTNMVVVLFKNSDRTKFEILALRSMRIVGANTYYQLRVRRGRYGTTQRTWLSGDVAWIIPRASLLALTADPFLGFLTNLSTATFRLQALSAGGTADVSDTSVCPNISYTFQDAFAPTMTFNSVQTGGAEITDFTTNYTTSTVFALVATITDASADLIEGRLYARLGATEVTLWSQMFTRSSTYTVRTQFSLPSNGEWAVYLAGRDSSGRVRTKQLTAGGGTSSATLKLGVGTGGTICASPTASPDAGSTTSNTLSVSLACSTAGATISYSLVGLGSAPGTYSTYSTAISVSALAGKTLWCYATKAGLTNSPVVSFDYWKETDAYIKPGLQLP